MPTGSGTHIFRLFQNCMIVSLTRMGVCGILAGIWEMPLAYYSTIVTQKCANKSTVNAYRIYANSLKVLNRLLPYKCGF